MNNDGPARTAGGGIPDEKLKKSGLTVSMNALLGSVLVVY